MLLIVGNTADSEDSGGLSLAVPLPGFVAYLWHLILSHWHTTFETALGEMKLFRQTLVSLNLTTEKKLTPTKWEFPQESHVGRRKIL